MWSVLEHTPPGKIELRLAFSQAEGSFHYALGTLNPDGGWPERFQLPDGLERFQWAAKDRMPVWAWQTPRSLTRPQLAKLALHDVAVTADYAICLDQGTYVEAGWWDALGPHLEQGTDYIGQPAWHDYGPGEAERILTEAWYVGVPLARREGRLGTAYMKGDFFAVRAERLREAAYPGEVWLGEMAHQQGWTQAVFDQYVKRD